MTEETEGKRHTFTWNLAGLIWPVMFAVLAMTGNCGVCGLDRDYLGQHLSKRCE